MSVSEGSVDLDALVIGNARMTINMDADSMPDLVNLVMQYDPEILKILGRV